MTLPANIRVNVAVPFPSMVQGSGPIGISKANGIWTLSFSVASFGKQNPPLNSLATDYVFVWDSVAQQFILVSLSNLVALFTGARNQRSVTASPIVIASTDMILNVNISAGSPTCALPAAAGRNGQPLTFVDVGLHFGAHNLTITPNGVETIVNAPTPTSLVLAVSGQTMTLTPFNDGTNTGWFIT